MPCLHCLLASLPAFFVHDDIAHSGPLTVPVTPPSLIRSSGGSGGGEQQERKIRQKITALLQMQGMQGLVWDCAHVQAAFGC